MEKTESAVHEEPTMCTKKEKIGHAILVSVSCSFLTYQSTFLSENKKTTGTPAKGCRRLD